jgi:hypothetical protein
MFFVVVIEKKNCKEKKNAESKRTKIFGTYAIGRINFSLLK